MTSLLLSFALLLSVFTVANPIAAFASVAMPPLPNRVAQQAAEAKLPFILLDRKSLNHLWDNANFSPYNQKTTPLFHRADGYLNPRSLWYAGDGPFDADSAFQPARLTPKDYRLYQRIVIDLAAANAINPRQNRIEALYAESRRLMDQLNFMIAPQPDEPSEVEAFARQCELFAIAVLMMDSIHAYTEPTLMREINVRMQEHRGRLSASAARLFPGDLPPAVEIRVGVALGWSGLYHMTMLEDSRQRRTTATSSAILPEVYRAVQFVHNGFDGIVGENGLLGIGLDELESVLLLAIPWAECLKRSGYPFGLPNEAYVRVVEAIEAHRIPFTSQAVVPNGEPLAAAPWNPPLYSLEPPQPSPEYMQRPEEETVIAGANNIGIPSILPPPPSLQGVNINMNRPGQQGLTLREQMERYGLGNPAPPSLPAPDPEPVSLDAGWEPPESLPLPMIWASVYGLAERERPRFPALERWEEISEAVDLHPYSLFFPSQRLRGIKDPPAKTAMLRYPTHFSALSASHDFREPYLIAAQGVNGVGLTATQTVNVEGFVYSEQGSTWRWIHESDPAEMSAYGASRMLDAPSDEPSVTLSTSQFSVYETYSPMGRTYAVRRHITGVGSCYNVIAHIPSERKTPIRFLNVERPPRAEILRDHNIPEWLVIKPQRFDAPFGELTLTEFQEISHRHRRGEIEIDLKQDLHLLFTPEAVSNVDAVTGPIGEVVEIEVVEPTQPFFYIAKLDLPGREMFDLKFPTLPLPGFRMLEWRRGEELLAVRQGEKIDNPFIDSDADFVIVSRDASMRAMFYLMVNGSYLRAKFSPQASTYTLLADAKGKRITAAWTQRAVHTNELPPSGSVFYAPNALAFECPGIVVDYGRKGRQVVVHGQRGVR